MNGKVNVTSELLELNSVIVFFKKCPKFQ